MSYQSFVFVFIIGLIFSCQPKANKSPIDSVSTGNPNRINNQNKGKSSDFNGDGFDDLAIGIPNKKINGIEGAGAVRVLYGSKNRLGQKNTRLLHRGNGLPDEPRLREGIGRTLAVGDFNGDGFADLIVGAPLAAAPGSAPTFGGGNFTVLYGSDAGLGVRSGSFIPNNSNVQIGHAISAGDFNNDGFDELAVGMPRAGRVEIFIGTVNGLILPPTIDNPTIGITKSGLGHGSSRNEKFGSALSHGDFNNDGFMDLAVGAPANGEINPPHGGLVIIVYGSKDGPVLSPVNSVQKFDQNTPGMLGDQETEDEFGSALITGNFDGIGSSDLAIGVLKESINNGSNSISQAGALNLLFGFGGLSTNDNQMWHQDIEGVGGQAENNDQFAKSLAGGDFNNDGVSDLVVGVSNEDFAGFVDAGVFHVFYGPTSTNQFNFQQLWHQDKDGMGYGIEAEDHFGAAFGTGDYNGDGFQDLAVSAPGEGIAGSRKAGSVLVLYGSTTGLQVQNHQLWTEHIIGFSGSESNDAFGTALSNASPMKRRNPHLHNGSVPSNEGVKKVE